MMCVGMLLVFMSVASTPSLVTGLSYPHDIICNNGTSHACICYKKDGSLTDYAADCDTFITPGQNLSVVEIQFGGLNLAGHTYTGDPYETQFKKTVAEVLSHHCTNHAEECPGTILPIKPNRVILLKVDCVAANEQKDIDEDLTSVQFIVFNTQSSFEVQQRYIMDAGLVTRLLTSEQRKLGRGVGGGMRVRYIFVFPRRMPIVPYPDYVEPETPGKTPVEQNKVLVYILSTIAASLCVCYVIAIYKVCVDYHQRKKLEKEKEKEALNNGQPTAYGAIGGDDQTVAAATSTARPQPSNVVNTQQQQPLPFVDTPQTVRKHVGGADNRRRSSGATSSYSSRGSSRRSQKSANNGQQQQHTAEITMTNESEEPTESTALMSGAQSTAAAPEPAGVYPPYEDPGYYVADHPYPEPPEPMESDQPDDHANYQYYNQYPEQYNDEQQQQGQDDANYYDPNYQYYNQYNYEAQGWDDQQYANDGTYPAATIQHDYANSQAAGAVDNAEYYPHDYYSQPEPTEPPPPLPPLPPLPPEAVSTPTPPSEPEPAVPVVAAGSTATTVKQSALGKSISLKSIERVQAANDNTSNQNSPLPAIRETPVRAGTIGDINKASTAGQADSDLSSDSDTDVEEQDVAEETTSMSIPATRVVPYNIMATPLTMTPASSVDVPDPFNDSTTTNGGSSSWLPNTNNNNRTMPPPTSEDVWQAKAVIGNNVQHHVPRSHEMIEMNTVGTTRRQPPPPPRPRPVPPPPPAPPTRPSPGHVIKSTPTTTTTMQGQFARSTEHLMNQGVDGSGTPPVDDPDVQQFKMIVDYDPNDKPAYDAETSSDAASSSAGDDDDENQFADSSHHHNQMQLTASSYARLKESQVSMNTPADPTTTTTDAVVTAASGQTTV